MQKSFGIWFKNISLTIKWANMKFSQKTILYLAIFATISMVLYAQFILGSYSKCFKVENALNSLGLSFGYSASEVMNFVISRSKQQLECYMRFVSVWDSIFALLYTLMYTLWIIYLFKKRLYLLSIPVLHMIADWTENYFEVSMIRDYLANGSVSENLISYGSTATILKWCLSIITYTIILSGITIKLMTYYKTRNSSVNSNGKKAE